MHELATKLVKETGNQEAIETHDKLLNMKVEVNGLTLALLLAGTIELIRCSGNLSDDGIRSFDEAIKDAEGLLESIVG